MLISASEYIHIKHRRGTKVSKAWKLTVPAFIELLNFFTDIPYFYENQENRGNISEISLVSFPVPAIRNLKFEAVLRMTGFYCQSYMFKDLTDGYKM